jgi:hypothetical protein
MSLQHREHAHFSLLSLHICSIQLTQHTQRNLNKEIYRLSVYRDIFDFFSFYVRYSTMLNLPPIRMPPPPKRTHQNGDKSLHLVILL